MYQDEPIRIFVVEDDPAYIRFLEYVLSLNPDFEVEVFNNGTDCLNNLHKEPTIITLDYSLPDLDGIEVLKQIKQINPEIPVIIVSSQQQVGTAVTLLKAGAYDYIIKDEETKDRLLNSIQKARQNISLIREIDQLREEISTKYEFEKTIIGSSPAIKKVFSIMEKATSTNITVSVAGETGTGKEVVAKAIHYNSPRKKKEFVAVNIAAIPKDLIESELFGHEKGSFTGAITRRIGKFEQADSGTIFLDEIAEMDINLQAKLLRVLQEKEVTRIGSNENIPIDVRVITATHKDLAEEVRKGTFREDLYYRLLGLPINLPPLRDRGKDVILIANHFLNEFSKENDLGKISFSNEAKEKLMKYHYPGNVRELKSIIELSTVMSTDGVIDTDDINFRSVQVEEDLLTEELTLRDYTFKIIRHFLGKYDNNVLLVADKLDIGKSTIYRYLKEMETENTV